MASPGKKRGECSHLREVLTHIVSARDATKKVRVKTLVLKIKTVTVNSAMYSPVTNVFSRPVTVNYAMYSPVTNVFSCPPQTTKLKNRNLILRKTLTPQLKLLTRTVPPSLTRP